MSNDPFMPDGSLITALRGPNQGLVPSKLKRAHIRHEVSLQRFFPKVLVEEPFAKGHGFSISKDKVSYWYH